jgi:hypothetical protein
MLVDVIVPLVLFYGLRRLGVDQFVALLAGATVPAVEAAHSLITRRRVGGVQIFMLGVMALTVAMSFVTGSARVLLIRNAWGMAALGGWMAFTLLARRPFLYEAGRVVFDEEQRRAWSASWERHTAFRNLLWTSSLVWAVACLLDAGLRVVLAMTMPVDAVPALDNGLLVVTLAVILLFQRFYGRSYLRRHGLRREGTAVVPIRAQ